MQAARPTKRNPLEKRPSPEDFREARERLESAIRQVVEIRKRRRVAADGRPTKR